MSILEGESRIITLNITHFKRPVLLGSLSFHFGPDTLYRVEVRRVCRESQRSVAVFLNDFVSMIHLCRICLPHKLQQLRFQICFARSTPMPDEKILCNIISNILSKRFVQFSAFGPQAWSGQTIGRHRICRVYIFFSFSQTLFIEQFFIVS